MKLLEEDNFKMEEMINRYKQKLGHGGEYLYTTSQSNESSKLI